MQRYHAFGLTIASEIPLNELSPASTPDAPADLTILRRDLGITVPEMGNPFLFDYEDPAGILMMWAGVGAVRIVDETTVLIQPHPDAPDSLLPFALLGPVMGWILNLRQNLVLHASAVNWHGVSFGFMGDKMAGKSTTAAAFIRDGAKLLTDDILAMTESPQGGFTIHPAFAQLKLSDEAAAAIDLGDNAQLLPPVLFTTTKRQHRLSGMHERPVRCDYLFVLDRGGDGAEIEWLSPGDALARVMRYSYSLRFSRSPVAIQQRDRLFRQSAQLVQTARVGRLRVQADLDSLQDVVALMHETIRERAVGAA